MDELEEELRNEIESLKEKNGLLEDENKDLNDLIVYSTTLHRNCKGVEGYCGYSDQSRRHARSF